MDRQLVKKVKTVLSRSFPRCEARIEPVRGNGRVWGILIWPKFQGIDQIDRQTRLKEVLDKSLSRDELRAVAAILTMTPAEVSNDD